MVGLPSTCKHQPRCGCPGSVWTSGPAVSKSCDLPIRGCARCRRPYEPPCWLKLNAPPIANGLAAKRARRGVRPRPCRMITRIPSTHRIMSKTRYGGASEAAKVLGKSTSQLNDIRDLGTMVFDPVAGRAMPLPSAEELRSIYEAEVGPLEKASGRYDAARTHYFRTRYLVCPSLYAYRMPGSAWEYNLTALEELRRSGPIAAASKSESLPRDTRRQP